MVLTWSTVVLSDIVNEDDVHIRERSAVMDLYLSETWPIQDGKSDLPEHWHTSQTTLSYHESSKASMMDSSAHFFTFAR